jgi:hypothetical protein
MRVDLDRAGGRVPRRLVTIPILTVTACLLCGLAATRVPAVARQENQPEPPVYLDTAEGLKRLEESDARQSFVPLSMYFVTQDTQTLCGVASSTMVLNALIPDPQRPTLFEGPPPFRLFAQSNFFTDQVEKIIHRKEVEAQGMILDKLGEVLGTFPVTVEVVHAGGTNNEDTFRKAAKEVLRSRDRFVILNYLRTAVGQETGGHFSPIAAYHENTDSFLVYDVARYKYPPSWVRTKYLWNAMMAKDDASSMTRGYLIVRKQSH